MRVTSVQLELKDEPKAAAVERVLALLDRTRGADLVLLPELWPTGYFRFERYAEEAEDLEGPTVGALRAKAAALKCHLLTGTFVERDGGKLFNTALLLGASGQILGRYRKIHLFGYGSEEQRVVTRGEEVVVAPTPWGRAGLSICYDLRFPELYRAQVDRGAELFLVTSSWPAARREAWQLFNRARAHENLAFLFSCNAAGTSAGKVLGGHSALVDPMGLVRAAGGEKEELISAEFDPGQAKAVRKEFPALADRILQGAGDRV